ncbi:MAG: HAD family hydrolase [Ilumatobacter sp.]|jgi:putative hydrolase of the HAD superfamily|uniref:HAD family hydrolase n=1 Tax=Ilumatobacter sp. TaxID=1967498 RepID=UPI00391A212B
MAETDRQRAVVFDFGGVLITSITNQLSEIATTHAVDVMTMKAVLLGPHDSGDHPWHRAERGEIPVEQIQDRLQPWAGDVGVELAGDEIERLLRPGGYTIVEEMIERVASLRAAGHATGLLTNTFLEFRPTMQRDIDFDLFDAVIESFAVGARKPEPAIYAAVERELGRSADEIVYLDDFAENLVEPIRRGWRTVHVGDHRRALADLEAVLQR